jgi:pimeloyl-ACP methyl ester carboxylesterase
MTEPRLGRVQCLDNRGLHRMAYWEWGDPQPACAGVCARPGAPGARLRHPGARPGHRLPRGLPRRGGPRPVRLAGRPDGLRIPTYVADMVTLVARLGVEQVDWVGTSMGGLIGLGLAAMKDSPVRRLVLNDVGPAIEPAAMQRIAPTWACRLLAHAGSCGRRAVGHLARLRAAHARRVAGPDAAAVGGCRARWRGRLQAHYDPASPRRCGR